MTRKRRRRPFRMAVVLAAAIGAGACAVFLSPAPRTLAEGEPARVLYVVDGDTVNVLWRGNNVRVRLLSINTPERDRPGYAEATDALRRLVAGRDVRLEFERPGRPERGKYGRLLAYVFVEGMNVNAEMVRLGHSRFWTKFGPGRYAADFRQAERKATRGQ